ncbi:MAG: TIGR00730 family Rossman fold protein [Clostridia bacterium]|nr:TIGR00730 family Rossman fold protein [Clostridia bacterium]
MKICVFGAASDYIADVYKKDGEHLGELLAEKGHSLVFGGGAGGLMGAVARGADRRGATIIGIAPGFFNVDGVLYENCTEFITTESMRERKFQMEEMSDAFIVAPGGIGTFEELFEVLTLKQLGRHEKPIVILNTNGYYDSMLQTLKFTMESKFLTEKCLELYKVVDTAEEAFEYIENYVPKSYSIIEMRGIKK